MTMNESMSSSETNQPHSDTACAAASTAESQPPRMINRELSLIAFNRRVLELAQDQRVPLLERVRFLCISCTNLDEFFEVRVAATRQRLALGVVEPGDDGLTPQETLDSIRYTVNELVENQYQVLNNELLPTLAENGILISDRHHWSAKQKRWLYRHFHKELMPVLSPLGLDPVHPFPRILNKSLNFAVDLDGTDAFGREPDMALVRAPRSLPRIIQIPHSHAEAEYEFVFLSDIIHAFVDELFPGMAVNGCYQFRVTRNSELFVDEEEIEDLARALQGELMERGFAEPVRLEVIRDCSDEVERFLTAKFGLSSDDVYRCDGPVNLNRLAAIHDLINNPAHKYQGFQPRLPAPISSGDGIFAAISRRDYVLHHPYDSFMPVVELLRQASTDPKVLAIKQTLYRTGADSVMVQLLIDAARAGKDVTVVVELRARFDEEANISLANRLQEAGVQVVYGIVGHKTHGKLLLIVRRERNGLRRYSHLGTGNYHQGTAKAYTDWCLITAHQGIGEDVHRVFQQLSGLGRVLKLEYLLHSPFTLHQAMLSKIEREIDHARHGREAKIHAKMNSLTEAEIIQALYRASQAGVEVRLIIRGICCLRPGVQGLSENIEVRSIMGRFLEHSRIYYFHNGGQSQLYLSSADWMERNLFHRVETCVPILRQDNLRRVYRESIELALADHDQAWVLQADGGYRRLQAGDDSASQEQLLHLLSRETNIHA
ncbi:MAG: polyphosphate kinase 1 [Wenzhouxiangellaceae bacterium]